MLEKLHKLLCFVGIHNWESIYRKSKCEYYPFPILVSKTCTKCGKIKFKEGMTEERDD